MVWVPPPLPWHTPQPTIQGALIPSQLLPVRPQESPISCSQPRFEALVGQLTGPQIPIAYRPLLRVYHSERYPILRKALGGYASTTATSATTMSTTATATAEATSATTVVTATATAASTTLIVVATTTVTAPIAKIATEKLRVHPPYNSVIQHINLTESDSLRSIPQQNAIGPYHYNLGDQILRHNTILQQRQNLTLSFDQQKQKIGTLLENLIRFVYFLA